MSTNKNEGMSMSTDFFRWLLKQGATIVFLSVAVYVIWNQNNVALTEIRECEDEKVKLLETVVKENTRANYELINYLKNKDEK